MRLGALQARRKPLQDSPTPAGNPAAAAVLLRLYAVNGSTPLRDAAVRTLETFAGVVGRFGLYAGSYGLALQRLMLPAVRVEVWGDDRLADELEAAALVGFAVNKTVLRRRGAGVSRAVVCRGVVCLAAVSDPDELLGLLEG